jgi:hypothetical protein
VQTQKNTHLKIKNGEQRVPLFDGWFRVEALFLCQVCVIKETHKHNLILNLLIVHSFQSRRNKEVLLVAKFVYCSY